MNWRLFVPWALIVCLGAAMWVMVKAAIKEQAAADPDTTHIILRARFIDVGHDSVEIRVEKVVVP